MASSKVAERYHFISEPLGTLKCVMCRRVALKPWQHRNCGRLFCKECLELYGKDIKPCPECGLKSPQYFEDKRGEFICTETRLTARVSNTK